MKNRLFRTMALFRLRENTEQSNAGFFRVWDNKLYVHYPKVKYGHHHIISLQTQYEKIKKKTFFFNKVSLGSLLVGSFFVSRLVNQPSGMEVRTHMVSVDSTSIEQQHLDDLIDSLGDVHDRAQYNDRRVKDDEILGDEFKQVAGKPFSIKKEMAEIAEEQKSSSISQIFPKVGKKVFEGTDFNLNHLGVRGSNHIKLIDGENYNLGLLSQVEVHWDRSLATDLSILASGPSCELFPMSSTQWFMDFNPVKKTGRLFSVLRCAHVNVQTGFDYGFNAQGQRQLRPRCDMNLTVVRQIPPSPCLRGGARNTVYRNRPINLLDGNLAAPRHIQKYPGNLVVNPVSNPDNLEVNAVANSAHPSVIDVNHNPNTGPGVTPKKNDVFNVKYSKPICDKLRSEVSYSQTLEHRFFESKNDQMQRDLGHQRLQVGLFSGFLACMVMSICIHRPRTREVAQQAALGFGVATVVVTLNPMVSSVRSLPPKTIVNVTDNINKMATSTELFVQQGTALVNMIIDAIEDPVNDVCLTPEQKQVEIEKIITNIIVKGINALIPVQLKIAVGSVVAMVLVQKGSVVVNQLKPVIQILMGYRSVLARSLFLVWFQMWKSQMEIMQMLNSDSWFLHKQNLSRKHLPLRVADFKGGDGNPNKGSVSPKVPPKPGTRKKFPAVRFIKKMMLNAIRRW